MNRLRYVWKEWALTAAMLGMVFVAPASVSPFAWWVLGALTGMAFTSTLFVFSVYGRLRYPD